VSEPYGYNVSVGGEQSHAPRDGSGGSAPSAPEEERPPVCPTCHRRLVILATQWGRDDRGQSVRRQLWGCPRGHATAYRTGGAFGPVELLPDVTS
jgi:hypothetical protein